MSKGNIEASIEFARTDTHTIIPFPTLDVRASAILYALISFHPYADGNKRTSLVVTSFFLFMNGYSLTIPDDAPEFTKGVAERCLDEIEHTPKDEIERVRKWLQPNLSQSSVMRLFYYLTRKRQTSLSAQIIWVSGFTIWNESALARMGQLGR